MLTLKCKEDFSKWLIRFNLDHEENTISSLASISNEADIKIFDRLPVLAQHGYLQCFFVEKGLHLNVQPKSNGQVNWNIRSLDTGAVMSQGISNSIFETYNIIHRTANGLYNSIYDVNGKI